MPDSSSLILAGLAVLSTAVAGTLAWGAWRLNRAARSLRAGDLKTPIPPSRIPLIREATASVSLLSSALNDLQRLEEYQQKMYAFEKKELSHFIEKEHMARQLETRLSEIQTAYATIQDLNVDLEEKNRCLNEAINRLSALNQISRMLGAETNREQLHALVVSLPLELLKARIGHLLLLDKVTGDLVLEFSRGLEPGAGLRRRIPMGKGVAGWVARNRKPLLIRDFSEQDVFSPVSSLGYVRKTAISVPIMIKDELMGVVTLINREDDQLFTEEDKTLLATMASETSIAIHNAILREKIENSYFGMVKSLITAVEAKDIYTRGHSERVTQYALLIGEELGLPGYRMDILKKAGILHDIGKVTVELAILNKPGILDQEEFDKIKLHPLVGYRILEPIDFEEEVKLCILQHHERLDRRGYPTGCDPRDLLLESRILSVADAFDAMTTKRPYRDPIELTSAMKELERCSGTQFDPEVVVAFRRKVDSMLSLGGKAVEARAH